jgi:hypothetical protein
MSHENVELVRGWLRPLALVVFALGVLLPSPALAVRGSPTGSHGPPGGVYGGRSSQDHPMSLRLTRDGKWLRSMFLRVDADMCSSSPAQGYSLPLHYQNRLSPPWRVAVRADGGFDDVSRWLGETRAGEKLDLDFEVVLKGQVGRTGAAGTIRVSGRVSDADGNVVDRCDSGTARWTLGRGVIYGGATYGGAIHDRTAVSVRLARDHKRLTSFFIDLVFACRSGTTSILVNHSLKHLAVPVRRDGSFSKRGYSLVPFETFQTPGGETATGQFLLRGELGARLASGSYRAFGTVRETDGRKWSCDTGGVRWTARRG